MHIADGILSPEVCAVTAVASIAAVGYSLHKLKDSLADRTIPLTGMMAALVFSGQMVNLPIGAMVSGHLMGGVLAAVILGPWAGCLALTTVLFVQLLFADGGLTALGANVLHMAVIGSIGGYAVYAAIRRLMGNGARGTLVGAVIASWLSVMAAAALFCIEFRLSWWSSETDFTRVLTLMVAFHSLIGIVEALITGCVISFVMSHRPDLIYSPQKTETTRPSLAGVGRVAAAGVVVALAVVAFLAPFASAAPDGMEAALNEFEGIDEASVEPTVLLLSDYNMPLSFGGWEEGERWEKLSVAVAGAGGIVVVVLIAAVFGWTSRLRSSLVESSHVE